MIVAVLLTLLVIAIAVAIILLRRKAKEGLGKIQPVIDKVLELIETECNPSRLFTDDEKTAVLDLSMPVLPEAMKLVESKFLSQEALTSSRIKKFIDSVDSINDLQSKNNKLFDSVCFVNLNAQFALDSLNGLLDDDHYFAKSEEDAFCEEYKQLFDSIRSLEIEGVLSLVSVKNQVESLMKYRDLKDRTRSIHNKQFCANQLSVYLDFFDRVLAYPLDSQQRDSIVKLEDNCLVISSAGSGKTSTMMGKILYQTDIRHTPPEKILAITYTRKAAQELSQRLGYGNLRCVTFHKLAIDIISEITGRRPSIASDDVFLNVFYDLLEQEKFLSVVVKYLEDYQSGTKDDFAYDSAVAYYADRKKYGVQALYSDMDDHFIFTKSEEEKKIVSILTHLGVSFRYEEPYEYGVYTPTYSQYRPDFSIHYQGNDGREHRLYLEHFAINANKEVPRWFGDGQEGGWYIANKKYNDSIAWKIETHRKRGTRMISTTSADFHSGVAEQKIRRALTACGVPIHNVPEKDLYQKIKSRSKSIERSLLQMCQGFVTLTKANRQTIDSVLAKAKAAKSDRDCFVIDKLMRPIFDSYQTVLVRAELIDFTDAIVLATEICEKGLWKEYEYILVDEFQDISVDRYHFLQSLRTRKPLTKLFCVGDDWQSIYRFSGSDMSLFSEFSKYFGYTEECKIETTYRFGNPAISLSSEFIQKNPAQRKKNVKPHMVLNPAYREGSVETNIPKMISSSTYLHFVGCEEKGMFDMVSRIVNYIPSDKSIYIIGRYTYDSRDLDYGKGSVKYDNAKQEITVVIDGRKIPYLTIHSSKGLEADYVIMINCNSGIYGFPSQISDDPALDYVLSDSDHYEYGEERRVFYVGITRAKLKTFILYDNRKPSPFVSEMDKEHSLQSLKVSEVCPVCKNGQRVALRRGVAKNGTEYIVWGCSNSSAKCSYFYREFKD